jgi:hypothetical protein
MANLISLNNLSLNHGYINNLIVFFLSSNNIALKSMINKNKILKIMSMKTITTIKNNKKTPVN